HHYHAGAVPLRRLYRAGWRGKRPLDQPGHLAAFAQIAASAQSVAASRRRCRRQCRRKSAMSAMTAALAAMALILAAGGLLLWQRAHLRSRQDRSAAFVDAQIRKEALLPPEAMPSELALGRNEAPEDAPWRYFFLRAGVDSSPRLYVKLIAPGLILTILALLLSGVLAAACTLLLYAMLRYFALWLKAGKRYQQM